MKSKMSVALGLCLAAGTAVAAPPAIRQVVLDALPRLAQNAAYQRVNFTTSVRMPSVADIATKLNGVLTRPIPDSPGARQEYLRYQEALLSPLAQTLSSEGATDEHVAKALEARARLVNAEAEALLPTLWATDRISADRLQELATKARTLLRQDPFLAQENEETAKAVTKVVEEQASLVLKQGIRRAERIARDFKDALRRAGLAEPEPTEWSDEAAEIKNWLAGAAEPGIAVPIDDAPDPAKLLQARLHKSSPSTKQTRDRDIPPLPIGTDLRNIIEAVMSVIRLHYLPHAYVLERKETTLQIRQNWESGNVALEISLEPRSDGKLLVKSTIWNLQYLLAHEGYKAEATEEAGVYLVPPEQVSVKESQQWYENLHAPEPGKRTTHEMIARVVMEGLPQVLPQGEKIHLLVHDSFHGISIMILYLLQIISDFHPEGIYVSVNERYADFIKFKFQQALADRGIVAEQISHFYLVHPRVLTPEQARQALDQPPSGHWGP